MADIALDVHISPERLLDDLRSDVRLGMTATPKWISPKWFYDARGSELFEQITELPEYYPTRTERGLIETHAYDVAERTNAAILVELGSGSSEKTRLLLNAGIKHGSLRKYVPQDVSPTALEGAIEVIAREHPGLEIQGIVSDFTDTLQNLPADGSRTIAFLGGTLGNLIPEERALFLADIAQALIAGEFLLLGVGLVVEESVVVPAYDDAAGVTAQFNANVLSVLNERLNANFDPQQFEHVALWNSEAEWIEMRLRARTAQDIRIEDLDLDVHFDEGEELRTEISAKFREKGIEAELVDAGFRVDEFWTDPESRFALILASRTSLGQRDDR
ncbi:L-histidine N(alpha)-methyltransferase [Rhodococcus sp. 14-2470-1b]|uniref:L-histidine N(alpha)-methyltransferase n=1 Tax=Rhodococcus sp. 14-2470-1b TaxID=2023149 RepID=UPI000B9C0381|nr:L-histidine N(alpha)-methyltransferase [Rhodococcus sp. 14-2470-1b]OZF56223.1 L-histidine N(alpha)-methyltransferase [Rhodococcus sp. 14-2470-1b]